MYVLWDLFQPKSLRNVPNKKDSVSYAEILLDTFFRIVADRIVRMSGDRNQIKTCLVKY